MINKQLTNKQQQLNTTKWKHPTTNKQRNKQTQNKPNMFINTHIEQTSKTTPTLTKTNTKQATLHNKSDNMNKQTTIQTNKNTALTHPTNNKQLNNKNTTIQTW